MTLMIHLKSLLRYLFKCIIMSTRILNIFNTNEMQKQKWACNFYKLLANVCKIQKLSIFLLQNTFVLHMLSVLLIVYYSNPNININKVSYLVIFFAVMGKIHLFRLLNSKSKLLTKYKTLV
jgi:hypothetical protein